MRTLCLSNPNLSGADAARWQEFLATKGVLTGRVDGVFGHGSDQATRAYQAVRTISPNGMVDSPTLAKALTDGFPGFGMAGMDASVNCSSAAAQLVAAGMKFVIRYYSVASGKAIKRAEALALSQAGLQIGVVYQDYGDQIGYFGATQGQKNAASALAQAAVLGQPAGSAIYFSADFNPTEPQIDGPLTEHFLAIAEVFAASPISYHVGVYGSGLMCAKMRAASLAQYTWLSQSTGFTDWGSYWAQANLVQSAPSSSLASISIDYDVAQTPDFGQFRVS